MVSGEEGDLTLLQRKVVHASQIHQDKSSSEISEIVNCSPSYVREIQQRYDNVIENIDDLSDLNYMPSFGHPYSIIVTDSFASENCISEGDVLQLNFNINGETETTYGEVKLYQEDMLNPDSREMQARVSGGYFAGDNLQEAPFPPFEDLPSLEDGRANLSTDPEFQEFISEINRVMNESLDDVHLLIGIGILEILHGERDPSNLVSTPFFDLERDLFAEYLMNEGPDLLDVHVYFDEPSEPEDVYFTCYGEQLTESLQEMIREKLLDQEYFKSTWNYTLPNHQAVVGPTTTEKTGNVLRVTEESLQVVSGGRRSVQFFSPEGNVADGLDGETVHDAILSANPRFESLASHSRHSDGGEDLPIRRNDDQIYFLFDQVTLVLTAEGDRIDWFSPSGIERIETIIQAVNSMIVEQLGLEDFDIGEMEPSDRRRVEQTDWILDTNALYHDHVADQPTSILHTIFPHRFFYESDLYIPWAVMFEMNKHPESGSGSKAANEQGIENLAMLRTLERLGYLSVNVQDPPEQIHTDIGNGDIADIYILAYTDMCDGQLITGDESLQNIAHLSDIPAVNISQLNSLTSPISSDSSMDEEILSRIGYELHTESEILDEIRNHINQDATVPTRDSSRQITQDSETMLESWCSQGMILPYYRAEEDTVCYAPSEEVTLVASQSVLSHLPEYIDGDSSEYLTEEFLSQLAPDINELTNGEYPYLKITVPAEYVISNATPEQRPSEFNEGLLQLARSENAQYRSEPAIQELGSSNSNDLYGMLASFLEDDDEEEFLTTPDYLALCIATRQDNGYLLLGGDQDNLWKFAKLLGVRTISVSVQ